MTEAAISDVLARLGDRPAAGGRSGTRPLAAVLVASDGTALLVVEADDEDAVRRAGEGAEIPFDRIVEATVLIVDGSLPRGS